MGEEQARKTNRIQADQFIAFKVFDNEGRVCEEGMALTKDISASGVLLIHRIMYESGTKFELQIALPEELLNAEGIVRNIREVGDGTFEFGIEFVNISENELKKLKKEFPEIL